MRGDLAAGIDIEVQRAGAFVELEVRQARGEFAASDRSLKIRLRDSDAAIRERAGRELELGGDALQRGEVDSRIAPPRLRRSVIAGWGSSCALLAEQRIEVQRLSRERSVDGGNGAREIGDRRARQAVAARIQRERMEREQAVFIACAAGQGLVAGPERELAERESSPVVGRDAVEERLSLKHSRGGGIEGHGDRASVEEPAELADGA